MAVHVVIIFILSNRGKLDRRRRIVGPERLGLSFCEGGGRQRRPDVVRISEGGVKNGPGNELLASGSYHISLAGCGLHSEARILIKMGPINPKTNRAC